MSNKSIQDRGDAFRNQMRERFEQARRSGKSPEQAQAEIVARAHQEARARAPQMAADVRSWVRGVRNFLIIGVLAVGLAIVLALSVENRYAAPLCRDYGAKNGLTYTGLQYPRLGKGSQRGSNSSGSCMFRSATGAKQTVSLGKLAPNIGTDLLMGAALTIQLTIPVGFVLIALIAATLFKRPMGAAQ